MWIDTTANSIINLHLATNQYVRVSFKEWRISGNSTVLTVCWGDASAMNVPTTCESRYTDRSRYFSGTGNKLGISSSLNFDFYYASILKLQACTWSCWIELLFKCYLLSCCICYILTGCLKLFKCCAASAAKYSRFSKSKNLANGPVKYVEYLSPSRRLDLCICIFLDISWYQVSSLGILEVSCNLYAHPFHFDLKGIITCLNAWN